MAVLRDYPLRLWEEQQEYSDSLLREFRLLLIGADLDGMHHEAPRALVDFAATFTVMFETQLEAVNEPRRRAAEAGLDRIDSPVPLIDGIEGILEQVDQLLHAADDFCMQGGLLILPRPEELRRLFDWTRYELVMQLHGGQATPWPGPF